MFYDDWMISLIFGVIFVIVTVSGILIYRYSDSKPLNLVPVQSPHTKVMPEANGEFLSVTGQHQISTLGNP